MTLPEELRTLRLCGNTLPETLTLFPPLTVRFVTNDVTSGVGYKGSYHFVKASGMFNNNISDDNNTEAEIMVCVENRALPKVLTVKPEVVHNIAIHASSTAFVICIASQAIQFHLYSFPGHPISFV